MPEPSTQHLLIALGEQELPARILGELGIDSIQALVDEFYPLRQPPIDQAFVERRTAQLAGNGREAPRPGPMPPVFERFTADARRIVAEDVLVVAERLGRPKLTTGHLLIALLEHPGEYPSEIISLLPDVREVTAAVIDALPGEEDYESEDEESEELTSQSSLMKRRPAPAAKVRPPASFSQTSVASWPRAAAVTAAGTGSPDPLIRAARLGGEPNCPSEGGRRGMLSAATGPRPR